MENREDFHRDDLLKRAVDSVLSDPIPGELPPDKVAQLAAVVQQAADRPYPITLIERVKNMKPRTKFAVVATILIACVGLMPWLVPGRGAALAFGDIVEALNGVHNATWKTTAVVEVPQKEPVTFNQIGMFLSPSHERIEITSSMEEGKSISITDGEKNKTVVLIPAKKTAIVMNFTNMPANNPTGRTFEGLRKIIADAQNGESGKVERLDSEAIDSRTAEGFQIQTGAINVKIWADPKTLLPIRVEQNTVAAAGPKVSIVMTDFQINKDLDESLFSLDIPPGYTVEQTINMDVAKLTKNPLAGLADALKMAAEYNNNVFPDTLRGEQGIDGILQRAMKTLAEKQGADPAALLKLQSDVSMKLGAAFGVVFALPPDACHYVGKGVKLGTPDRPIFWVKQKKGGQCMVIYADACFKEVPAEELPKVPQAEDSPKP